VALRYSTSFRRTAPSVPSAALAGEGGWAGAAGGGADAFGAGGLGGGAAPGPGLPVSQRGPPVEPGKGGRWRRLRCRRWWTPNRRGLTRRRCARRGWLGPVRRRATLTSPRWPPRRTPIATCSRPTIPLQLVRSSGRPTSMPSTARMRSPQPSPAPFAGPPSVSPMMMAPRGCPDRSSGPPPRERLAPSHRATRRQRCEVSVFPDPPAGSFPGERARTQAEGQQDGREAPGGLGAQGIRDGRGARSMIRLPQPSVSSSGRPQIFGVDLPWAESARKLRPLQRARRGERISPSPPVRAPGTSDTLLRRRLAERSLVLRGFEFLTAGPWARLADRTDRHARPQRTGPKAGRTGQRDPKRAPPHSGDRFQ